MLPLNVEETYREVGETPHLDRRYAVFDQVFEWMAVVAAMPFEPAVILSVEFTTY